MRYSRSLPTSSRSRSGQRQALRLRYHRCLRTASVRQRPSRPSCPRSRIVGSARRYRAVVLASGNRRRRPSGSRTRWTVSALIRRASYRRMREGPSRDALSLRYRLECDPGRAVPLHPTPGQPQDLRLEHPAVQVCVVRPDAAEPPVFCRRDACDDHRRSRATLDTRLGFMIIRSTRTRTGDDVFSVQTRNGPPGGGADVERRRQSSPPPHDGVQDGADLQIVRDAGYVLCLDFPMPRELGRSLGTRDQLALDARASTVDSMRRNVVGFATQATPAGASPCAGA